MKFLKFLPYNLSSVLVRLKYKPGSKSRYYEDRIIHEQLKVNVTVNLQLNDHDVHARNVCGDGDGANRYIYRTISLLKYLIVKFDLGLRRCLASVNK